MSGQPTRVWAIVNTGRPGGQPVEMHRTAKGWAVDMGVHYEAIRYTALVDGKFVDFPAGEVVG